jgi:putative endopeptidase
MVPSSAPRARRARRRRRDRPARRPGPTRAARHRPANLDTTCSACDDFFQFANGGWLKKSTIPPAYARWGSFNELQDQNEGVLRTIVEAAAAQPRPNARAAGRPDRQAVTTVPVVDARNSPQANVQKIGAFFRSCVDSAGLEAAGYTPIRPLLGRIDAIKSPQDLARALGPLEAEAGLAPFGAGPGPDAKNSNALIVGLSQGGLGLPDRDFYLKDDERAKATRAAYVEHAATYFTLTGADAATAGRTPSACWRSRRSWRRRRCRGSRCATRTPSTTRCRWPTSRRRRRTSTGPATSRRRARPRSPR